MSLPVAAFRIDVMKRALVLMARVLGVKVGCGLDCILQAQSGRFAAFTDNFHEF